MGAMLCVLASKKDGDATSPLTAALGASLTRAVVRNKRRKSFEVTRRSFNNLMLQLPKLTAGFKIVRQAYAHSAATAGDGKVTWSGFRKCCGERMSLEAESDTLKELFDQPTVSDRTLVSHADVVIMFMVIYLLDGITKRRTITNPECRKCLQLVEQSFMFFDSTADGCIERKELAYALKSGTRVWGRNTSKTLADHLFEQLSWTKDGRIAFQDFLWGMERIVMEMADEEEEGMQEEDGVSLDGDDEGHKASVDRNDAFAKWQQQGSEDGDVNDNTNNNNDQINNFNNDDHTDKLTPLLRQASMPGQMDLTDLTDQRTASQPQQQQSPLLELQPLMMPVHQRSSQGGYVTASSNGMLTPPTALSPRAPSTNGAASPSASAAAAYRGRRDSAFSMQDVNLHFPSPFASTTGVEAAEERLKLQLSEKPSKPSWEYDFDAIKMAPADPTFPRASTSGLGASSPGLRASTSGLRASISGLPVGPSGLRASTSGFKVAPAPSSAVRPLPPAAEPAGDDVLPFCSFTAAGLVPVD